MSRELTRLRKSSMQKVETAQALQAKKESITSDLDDHLSQIQSEYRRVTLLSQNAVSVIDEIDRQFQRATKLTSTDISFLFLATALQCARQYLLTPATIRLGDQEAAQKVKDSKEHSNRSHRLYNPSLEEIITNPVPFDAISGSSRYNALSGYGALGHRGATIGHDPLLGLIFGTANIATSTLTTWSMESFHIATAQVGYGNRDIFSFRANTEKVLAYTFGDKLLRQGMDGKIIVGTSVAKEIKHLQSDMYSKDSLPLPIISAVDPVLAGNLAKQGLDMASVLDTAKQFSYAVAIDTLIALIHGLFYDASQDGSRIAYDIRTRPILIYSNLLASTSNVIISLMTSKRFLDIGGYINTLRHIVFDLKFIAEVKLDFLKNELYDRIVGSEYDFMEGK